MGRNARCIGCGGWECRNTVPVAVGILWCPSLMAYQNTQALKRVCAAVVSNMGRRGGQSSKCFVRLESLFFTGSGRRTKTKPGERFAEVLHEGLGIVNL